MPKSPQPVKSTVDKILKENDTSVLYSKDDSNKIIFDAVDEINPKPNCIKCACHTHLLEVQKFEDEDDYTYLTFWGYDGERYPWSYRLKMIWNLITKGSDSIQEFVLSQETKQDLIKFLQE